MPPRPVARACGGANVAGTFTEGSGIGMSPRPPRTHLPSRLPRQQTGPEQPGEAGPRPATHLFRCPGCHAAPASLLLALPRTEADEAQDSPAWSMRQRQDFGHLQAPR
jgi:hypothetical protein